MDEELLAMLKELKVRDPRAYETLRLLVKKALSLSEPRKVAIPAPPRTRESSP